MKRQEPTPTLVEPLDDPMLTYEALASVEDLDPVAPATGGEGEPLLVETLTAAAEDLELVGQLEDAELSGLAAEGEDSIEPSAHSYEGVDLDEIEALAHHAEGVESETSSDDESESSANYAVF